MISPSHLDGVPPPVQGCQTETRPTAGAGQDLKPNGKPDGVFVISIDDGYCEWSYDLEIDPSNSISNIIERIAILFSANANNPRERINHVSSTTKYRTTHISPTHLRLLQ